MRAVESELGEFYVRQVALPELGVEGQKRLRKSRAVIVGLGGLGSVSALYLTLAGVSFLRLIDQDTVETHNLHRQALYSTDDLRYPKVEVAAKRLKKVNPDVEIEPVADNLRQSNIHELIHDTNCVVDGLDNVFWQSCPPSLFIPTWPTVTPLEKACQALGRVCFGCLLL